MELLIANSALSWLCLVALFAFAELFFPRYVLVWFSVGCTAGLLASLCLCPLWLQITLAATISLGLLWISRTWVKQVRCDDAMLEIMPEGMDCGTTAVFSERGIGNMEKNEASTVTILSDDPDSCLFSESQENGTNFSQIPYPISLTEL